MSAASPSDSRLKWRKRKRDPSNNLDDDEEEDDEPEDDDQDSPPNPNNPDPILDLRESEVLSDLGVRISDFPVAFKRSVNRPHGSVISLVAAEKFGTAVRSEMPMIENISHGQLQAKSSVAGDNCLLLGLDMEKAGGFVCTPPVLMEGKGVEKRFGDGRVHMVPMHSDWFSSTTVHRLERQVVPHYFSGKSADHTPEKYLALRNKIISKYLENPGKRLAFADCQGLVSSSELYDLSRIVRFLDNWGIINYMSSSHRLRMAGSLLAGSLIKEDVNGELNVQTSHLRSIDSLILFDKPKCSIRLEDINLLVSSAADRSKNSDGGSLDLDRRIRERLSEHACSYCFRPLPDLHYQSQKEVDIILCSDCFHDAKFILGHSSIDFVRVDSRKDAFDPDGDSWTDQETLLLLEALEKHKDNWNEIAEYVGTKSKAQCILHFLRLPMEDGSLESIEVMQTVGSSDSKGQDHGLSYSNTNGDISATCSQEAIGNQIPFANSANPVMSLVAFLASAIGPRVAAACASASLAVLTKVDSRSSSEKIHGEVGSHEANVNLDYRTDLEDQNRFTRRDATYPVAPKNVKFAAMCGLSAAATKAKLFADQEEREVQRLSATIINHQLKRLELKLKQFAEVETFLMKQCEQVEKTRQRFSTDRANMMSNRFVPQQATSLPPPAAVNTNPRPPTVSGPPATFSNNIPQMQQFMQRQQQMYGFGPRLPLSAIHPASAAPAPTQQQMMFNSGVTNTTTPNHHPLLRSSSGNNSSIG